MRSASIRNLRCRAWEKLWSKKNSEDPNAQRIHFVNQTSVYLLLTASKLSSAGPGYHPCARNYPIFDLKKTLQIEAFRLRKTTSNVAEAQKLAEEKEHADRKSNLKTTKDCCHEEKKLFSIYPITGFPLAYYHTIWLRKKVLCIDFEFGERGQSTSSMPSVPKTCEFFLRLTHCCGKWGTD